MTIHLTLPLPPPPNRWPSNPMALHRAKRKYQRRCWLRAASQVIPPLEPPEKVLVSALLYVHNLRDEDGAVASLKWTLDALRQSQRGSLKWREGWRPDCGYFVDDDPRRLALRLSGQEIDRDDPRVELTVEALT